MTPTLGPRMFPHSPFAMDDPGQLELEVGAGADVDVDGGGLLLLGEEHVHAGLVLGAQADAEQRSLTLLASARGGCLHQGLK